MEILRSRTIFTACLLAGAVSVSVAPTVTEAAAWSAWKKSDCHGAIEYRVRHLRSVGTDRHQWAVDFRNRLRQAVHFRWTLTEQTTGEARLHNEMTLQAGGQLRRNAMTGGGPGIPARVLIGHLRIGGKDTPEEACDRKS